MRPRNNSLLPSVSVVSLSQCWGANLPFFYKNNRPIFQTFLSESEKLRFSILQIFHNCQVSPKNQCFVDNGLCIRKTGCWVFFLRTAIRSLKIRGDIRKQLVAGSNTRPTMIYIHPGVLGDCVFLYPRVISRLSLQIGR